MTSQFKHYGTLMIYVQRNKIAPSVIEGSRSERLAVIKSDHKKYLIRRRHTFERVYLHIRAEDWHTGEPVHLWEIPRSLISKWLFEHGFNAIEGV